VTTDKDGVSVERRAGAGAVVERKSSSSRSVKKMVVVDPPAAVFFPLDSPSQSVHSLSNPTGGRMAVKVKCSDNALYRVNPVFALLEPGSVQQLVVARGAGAAKAEKLLIQFLEAGEAGDPRQVFAATPNPATSVTVPLLPGTAPPADAAPPLSPEEFAAMPQA